MISQTVTDGLKPYAIGEKIRALRLKKSMGLVELGKHTGLSAALLSKLERGKLFPTLPTLLRVASSPSCASTTASASPRGPDPAKSPIFSNVSTIPQLNANSMRF